ncbi:hypothetical protein [Fibrella aquatica]|uniref:hypothetical protein n=1 Tax=Fibrella aquatica TaxID=3242487 RepID=UPI0035200A6F
MHAAIQAWLDQANPDYNAGLELLKQTGLDPASLTGRLLQRGSDSFTRVKLSDALTKALASIAPLPAPVIAPVDTPAVPAPASLQKPVLNLGIPPLLNERSEAKAQLRAILADEGKDDPRRVLALRIKAITRELDALYNPREEPAPEPMKLLNVRASVSRYRKRVREATDPAKKEAAQQQLTHYEALLAQMTHHEKPV